MTRAMSDAEAEAADERPREAHEPADRGRGDRDHDEVEEVGRAEGVEARGDQHARPARRTVLDSAQLNADTRSARIAVQLGHARALDDGPHAQADRRVAEQHGERRHR